MKAVILAFRAYGGQARIVSRVTTPELFAKWQFLYWRYDRPSMRRSKKVKADVAAVLVWATKRFQKR